MQSGEGAKIPQKVASEFKKQKYPSINIRSSAAITIQNATIKPGLIKYATEDCFYDIGASQIIR